MKDLEGRVAVITGGGSGIGRATALAFAREGTSVVVVDIDIDRAAETEADVKRAGVDAVAVRCDVTSEQDLSAVRDLAFERFGRVDIVMNNVSVIAVGLPLDIPLVEWQFSIDVNLLSIVRSNQVFLPVLLDRGEGHVVNTASTAGLYAYTYERLPYSATKAAIVGMSEALALYLRPRGIGVTCLCPGPVATNIVEQMRFFGEPRAIQGPTLPMVDAAVAGDVVVEAVRADRFLALTHPEVRDILVRRAQDPDAFLRGQIEPGTA